MQVAKLGNPLPPDLERREERGRRREREGEGGVLFVRVQSYSSCLLEGECSIAALAVATVSVSSCGLVSRLPSCGGCSLLAGGFPAAVKAPVVSGPDLRSEDCQRLQHTTNQLLTFLLSTERISIIRCAIESPVACPSIFLR